MISKSCAWNGRRRWSSVCHSNRQHRQGLDQLVQCCHHHKRAAQTVSTLITLRTTVYSAVTMAQWCPLTKTTHNTNIRRFTQILSCTFFHYEQLRNSVLLWFIIQMWIKFILSYVQGDLATVTPAVKWLLESSKESSSSRSCPAYTTILHHNVNVHKVLWVMHEE